MDMKGKFKLGAALLLLISGSLLVGVGAGLAFRAPEAGATIGLGSGMVISGLVVARRVQSVSVKSRT